MAQADEQPRHPAHREGADAVPSLFTRRDWLAVSGLALGALATRARGQSAPGGARSEQALRERRRFLESVMPKKEEVEAFINKTPGPDGYNVNNGFTFDPDLGWIGARGFRTNAVNGSKWFANYEADGARVSIAYGGEPCRIHTYGDSFTHGSQVNDGETWQEYLAAHFCEPVRNYGVGGFSVYQAYRRMRLIEAKRPAEYIVLNIYDDDHFRNLDAWRAIRWGAGGGVGFSLPYVEVDPERDHFREVDNVIQRPQDVHRLRDPEFVWATYKDDKALDVVLATRGRGQVGQEWIEPPETIFGLPLEKVAPGEATQRIQALYTRAALYASQRVVQLTEQFCREHGKKLMVILSFGRGNLRKRLSGEERFDRTFLEWIRQRPYPVVDMLGLFEREYAQSKLSLEDFIRRYYIGHHTPEGNHFTAMALVDPLVAWLNPKPLTRR